MATATAISATELYEELKAASFQGLENGKATASMFPCGNAVVIISNTRTKIAQELKKKNLAQPWSGRGISINSYAWLGFAQAGQSYDLNVAVCEEMVRLLEGYGIQAYVHAWID